MKNKLNFCILLSVLILSIILIGCGEKKDKNLELLDSCKELEGTILRDPCVQMIAVKVNDLNLCERIDDEDLKQECIDEIKAAQ